MSESILEEVSVASNVQVEEVVVAEAIRLPSYRPYPWPLINRLFDIVDDVTHGRAGLVQRFSSFVVIGGFAALVNLIVFFVAYHVIKMPAFFVGKVAVYHVGKIPVSDMIHNGIASVLAAEISIMANFIPNDYFTFGHMAGGRSWGARCVRFHITSIGGSLLTFLIQFSLSNLLHILPILSQAIALILVLFYNFSFHHIFTYRHVKLKTAN
jgi:putative flippase GtrA